MGSNAVKLTTKKVTDTPQKATWEFNATTVAPIGKSRAKTYSGRIVLNKDRSSVNIYKTTGNGEMSMIFSSQPTATTARLSTLAGTEIFSAFVDRG